MEGRAGGADLAASRWPYRHPLPCLPQEECCLKGQSRCSLGQVIHQPLLWEQECTHINLRAEAKSSDLLTHPSQCSLWRTLDSRGAEELPPSPGFVADAMWRCLGTLSQLLQDTCFRHAGTQPQRSLVRISVFKPVLAKP